MQGTKQFLETVNKYLLGIDNSVSINRYNNTSFEIYYANMEKKNIRSILIVLDKYSYTFCINNVISKINNQIKDMIPKGYKILLFLKKPFNDENKIIYEILNYINDINCKLGGGGI
ncbi:hypothetical protein ACAG39_09470 [Caldicellulosiruptoraceae bacterium PP1]